MAESLRPGTERILTRAEQGLIVFLFVNPFLDFVTGYMMNNGITLGLPASLTVSLMVRMAVLGVMALYVLARRDWSAVWTVVPIGLAALLSVASELMAGNDVELFADIQYASKFIYNVAAFLVFWHVLKRRYGDRETRLALLNRLFTWAAFWVAGSILATFALDIYASSYYNFFGTTGVRGFFFSGNEATAILMALLPFGLRDALLRLADGPKRLRDLLRLLPPALTVNALLLIGTKTAFAGIGLSLALLLVYALVEAVRYQRPARVYTMICVLGVAALVYVGMGWVTDGRSGQIVDKAVSLQSYYLKQMHDLPQDIVEQMTLQEREAMGSKESFLGRLLSGRMGLLNYNIREWRGGLPVTWLFGLGRGSRLRVIEMDLSEIFLFYGVLGVICFCWPYARQLWRVAGAFLRRWDFDGYCAAVSLGAVGSYALLAGHVFFTVTGGFYFALILLYATLHYDLDPMQKPLEKGSVKNAALGALKALGTAAGAFLKRAARKTDKEVCR
ncbi:MAG: O-antigen ligase family protein [Oscillospiraceae bacterium]|nr:O-antigen ligase family protein [Oscillospiraceae bacterium]